jgi:DnaJ-domain-containing protein 1
MLVPTKAWKESKKEDEMERENEQAIDHLYLYGAKCFLQYGVTSYVDGIGASCLEDDSNQWCSVCQRDPRHHPQDIHTAMMSCWNNLRAALLAMVDSTPHMFIEATEQAKALKVIRDTSKLREVEWVQHAL